MELAIQKDSVSPATRVLFAKDVAQSLMDIVEQTHAYAVISGKRYLQLEAWQFIGTTDDTFPSPEYVIPIEEDGEVVAYEAKVNLVKDGIIVGSGIMECGMDESVTQGRTGRAKHNACKSMAQTRATSKAFRLKYSWVATMAGFQPATAEEMQGQSASPQYFCQEHQTEWFMRGKMTSYAHPVDGQKEWCQMRSAGMEGEIIPESAQETRRQVKLTPETFMDTVYRRFSYSSNDVFEILGIEPEEFEAFSEEQLREAGRTIQEAFEASSEGPPPDEELERQMQM